MSTLTRMKRLTRQPKGQISCSSDREIVDEIRAALIQIGREVKITGEELEIQHLVNAWCHGIARLPEEQRMAVSRFLVADLERWMLEQRQLSGEELLAGLRVAIAPAQPEKAEDSGGGPRLRGRHTVGRAADVEDVFKPGQAGPGRRTDRKKMGAESHC